MHKIFLLISFICLAQKAGAQFDSTEFPVYKLLGKAVPVFTALTVDHKPIHADYFHNKYTILVFSSPGCVPCKFMLPKLDQWTKQFSKDTFQVLYIYDADSMLTRDVRSAKSRQLGKFKRSMGIDSLAFDCVAECSAKTRMISRFCLTHSRHFGVRSWPSTFFIDRTGIIRNVMTGYAVGDTKDMDLLFDLLLSFTVSGQAYPLKFTAKKPDLR